MRRTNYVRYDGLNTICARAVVNRIIHALIFSLPPCGGESVNEGQKTGPGEMREWRKRKRESGRTEDNEQTTEKQSDGHQTSKQTYTKTRTKHRPDEPRRDGGLEQLRDKPMNPTYNSSSHPHLSSKQSASGTSTM